MSFFRTCRRPSASSTTSAYSSRNEGPGLLSSGAAPGAAERPLVRIAFAGRQVAVRSHAPEVLAGLERTFRSMLAQRPGRTVGQIEISRRGAGYDLPATGEASVRGGSLADVLACAGYHVKRLLVAATPELLWLHASAAAGPAGAVLFVGPSGSGKSTLAAALCDLGWRYLSDDLVALDPASGVALPFPQTPAFRVGPGHELPAAMIQELPKTEPSLEQTAAQRRPAAVDAVVFPSFSMRAPAALEPCPPAAAALELVRSCLNVRVHGEQAVRLLCGLARDRPAYGLSFDRGQRAAELVDLASRQWPER